MPDDAIPARRAQLGEAEDRDYWRYGQEVDAIKRKIERGRAFV